MSAEGEIIELETLANAIRVRTGVGNEEAQSLAETVLSYFGFETRVVDNLLTPEDRRTFYRLYDAGILSSEYEETILANGRIWRIFYWEINMDNIRATLERGKQVGSESSNVYETLPPVAWEKVKDIRQG